MILNLIAEYGTSIKISVRTKIRPVIKSHLVGCGIRMPFLGFIDEFIVECFLVDACKQNDVSIDVAIALSIVTGWAGSDSK